jgi:hypothetical protein
MTRPTRRILPLTCHFRFQPAMITDLASDVLFPCTGKAIPTNLRVPNSAYKIPDNPG